MAQQARTAPEYDNALVEVAGIAYRVPRQAGEALDLYAKRIVKRRDSEFPSVKSGQWLLALVGIFSGDMAERCATLSRFTRERNERGMLDKIAAEMKMLSAQAKKALEAEGAKDGSLLLPKAEVCDKSEGWGAQAQVRAGAVNIEGLDRVRFVEDQAPADKPRTSLGALRELVSALSQYDNFHKTLSPYDSSSRKNRGNMRVSVSGSSPAVYLNELVRAGVEAGVHTAHLLATKKDGTSCVLKLTIAEPKRKPKGKKHKAAKRVKCKDDVSLQKCVDHLIEAKSEGPIFFATDSAAEAE